MTTWSDPDLNQTEQWADKEQQAHLADHLDASMAELEHWSATGQRVTCERCTQLTPATATGEPVRHQLRGQWCEVSDTSSTR